MNSLCFQSGYHASLPTDQIALWFYVDESKSQLLKLLSILCHAWLCSHFERLTHHKRAHFTSIQSETETEKRGVPSKSLSLAFGGRLAAARKLSDHEKRIERKRKKHICTYMIHIYTKSQIHTLSHFHTNANTHTYMWMLSYIVR